MPCLSSSVIIRSLPRLCCLMTFSSSAMPQLFLVFQVVLPDVFPRFLFCGIIYICIYILFYVGLILHHSLRFVIRDIVGDYILGFFCFLVCFAMLITLCWIIPVTFLFRVS